MSTAERVAVGVLLLVGFAGGYVAHWAWCPAFMN